MSILKTDSGFDWKESQMPSSVKSINVLLIENDCADAKTLLCLLDENRCDSVDLTVKWVSTLASGLAELSAHKYDAVLLN
ncbi:hypothetical protein ACSFCC_12155, partial [Glaesserella parasuis]|uniref:hypothetical protein n=1 Tax=Glaesserella parasuis TaxID=738 RepID=UPI003F350A9A